MWCRLLFGWYLSSVWNDMLLCDRLVVGRFFRLCRYLSDCLLNSMVCGCM